MSPPDTKKTELEKNLTRIRRQEEEEQASQLAAKFNLPYLDLAIRPIDPDDLIILDETKAKKGNLLVIKKTDHLLHLAIKDPADPQTKKTIQELQGHGFECQLFVVSLASLKKGWQKYRLAEHPHKDVPLRDVFILQENEFEEFKNSLQTIQNLQKSISVLSTSRLLGIIITGAIKMDASDIHLEPAKEDCRVRYRIDGLLQDIAQLPLKEYHFLLSRIKTLSGMFLNINDVSQDGRFTVRINRDQETIRAIDIRSSILPSNYGESIALRLLGLAVAKLDLNQLGIRPELFKIIEKQVTLPHGMILSTGPTGSGKTTTLYACLNFINQPGTKIITVEDPIEYQLDGITQTQINREKGHTFNKALRAIVRQDPDVLMLGEVRDKESADIAVQFALTGHLVFSTLHTNDAAGAIPRLTGMKVDPASLCASLNLIIAQRLVRKLCPACKEPVQPDPKKVKEIKKILSTISPKANIVLPQISKFYRAKGCPQCHGLGFQGRIGLFELLTISEPIKKLILEKAGSFNVQGQAQKEGMVLLNQDALLKVIEGVTSLEEIERVIGSLQLLAEQTSQPAK